jgi:hypothetical protein
MRFGRLIVLLLAALPGVLLVEQAQCLAACAVDDCEQNLPPCHRHHSDPSKDRAAVCLHDAVVSPAMQVYAADLPAVQLPSFTATPPLSAGDMAPPRIDSSPPGPSIAILRI